jgi:hypothetical protein
MDMVAYPLSMHADLLHTESAVCAAGISEWVTTALQRLRRISADGSPIRMVADFMRNAWREVEGVPVLQQYRDRILGLGCSMYAHIIPASSGTALHAQFLPYNIDAVTVSLSPASAKIAVEAPNRRTETHGVQKLTEVALSFVYISNNLHGMFIVCFYNTIINITIR